MSKFVVDYGEDMDFAIPTYEQMKVIEDITTMADDRHLLGTCEDYMQEESCTMCTALTNFSFFVQLLREQQ